MAARLGGSCSRIWARVGEQQDGNGELYKARMNWLLRNG